MSAHKNFIIAATTAGDSVRSVTITNGGSSYETAPTVAFAAAPAGGRTATGIAVLSADAVDSITITDGGKGYVGAPAVTFTGGGGSAAAGTAVITAAALDSNAVTWHQDGSWSWVITKNAVARRYSYRGSNKAVNELLKEICTGSGGRYTTENIFGTN